jgi:hypothetical protein
VEAEKIEQLMAGDAVPKHLRDWPPEAGPAARRRTRASLLLAAASVAVPPQPFLIHNLSKSRNHMTLLLI